MTLEGWLAESYARSFRTAVLILHNRADAEEAVQDAFLRAWRFRDAMPEGERAAPWLYRVVVNACLTKLRRRRDVIHDPVTGDDDEPDAVEVDPTVEAALGGETTRVVIEALARLPEHLRVVTVLRYYAGLTESDIAIAIRRRPGTVKSRLHEARHRLGVDAALVALVRREEA